MLWTVLYLWPSGARFDFSSYRHWSWLVLYNENGMAIFMHSREGVTQGEPLNMVTYLIGVLLLIKCLKEDYRDVTQTWYAANAGALGIFDTFKERPNHASEKYHSREEVIFASQV